MTALPGRPLTPTLSRKREREQEGVAVVASEGQGETVVASEG